MTLKVLCARSMTSAVTALSDKFARATGQKLDLAFGTVGALQARLAAGETADVVILGAPAVARMEQAGAVVAGSTKDIARTSIGIAVREGARAPDISTPVAFERSLTAARTVAFSDAAVGGSAGVHLAALWQRMGLAEEMRLKGMPQTSGGEVAARVADARPHPHRGDRAGQGRARDRQAAGAVRQRYDLCRRHLRGLQRRRRGGRSHFGPHASRRARRLDRSGI
jgi:hypothetical protein